MWLGYYRPAQVGARRHHLPVEVRHISEILCERLAPASGRYQYFSTW